MRDTGALEGERDVETQMGERRRLRGTAREREREREIERHSIERDSVSGLWRY